MLKKIIIELIGNKDYLKISIFINLLLIIPHVFIYGIQLKSLFATFLLFLLLFFLSVVNRILYICFSIFVILSTIIQMNLLFHWGKEVAIYDLSSRIAVSLESPFYEKLEYLNTYVNLNDYLYILYLFVIIFIIIRYLYKYRYNFIVIRFFSIFFVIILIYILRKHYPFNLINEYTEANSMVHTIQQRTKVIENTKKKGQFLNNIKLYDKIIIILGESANKNFLNIYGYPKKTTPFLSSLKGDKNFYIYNAISGANQTRYVIPMLLTKANILNWEYNYVHSRSIISDFKDWGYKTHWISNQAIVGKHEGFINSISKEADENICLNKGDYSSAKTDMELIKNLYSRNINNDKEMYIFHLIGSHFKYQERYLKGYLLNKNPKNIKERYENTIYFTDVIIEKIFNYFNKQRKKILIVYLSDHGEIVHLNKFGHGFNPTFKDEYEIPLVAYSSINNDRLNKLKEININHYFNTESFNYFIEYISGISNDINISSSSTIFSLEPKNIFDFEKIKRWK